MADSSGEDVSFRTLINKVVATDVNLTPVRPNTRLWHSEYQKSSAHWTVGTSESVRPAQILVRKMKEKIRRSARLMASARQSLPPRPESLKRAVKAPLLNLDDTDTPRTILRNIKQTQPEAKLIPKVPQRRVAKDPQPEMRLETTQNSSTDVSLSDMSSDYKTSAVAPRQKRKKPVSLAEFTRGVDEKIQRYQEMNSSMQEELSKNILAMANRSGLIRSFQLVPDTPAEPESIQKKGLARRPRKRRMINVEDFEQRVEQKFQLLKGGDGVTQERKVDNNISPLVTGSVTKRKETEERKKSEKRKKGDVTEQKRHSRTHKIHNAILKSPQRLAGNSEKEDGNLQLQLGLDSLLEPESVVKKGLARRPKKHRIINLETFEGGVEQKFQQLKGSQECYIDPSLTAIDRSSDKNNTDIVLSNTELYAQPLPKDQLFQYSSPARQMKSRGNSLFTEEIRHADASQPSGRRSEYYSYMDKTQKVSSAGSQKRFFINNTEGKDVSIEEGEEHFDFCAPHKYEVSMEVEEQMDSNMGGVDKTVSMEDADFEHIDRMAASSQRKMILSSTKLLEHSQGVSFGKSLLVPQELLEDSVFQSALTSKSNNGHSIAMRTLSSSTSRKKLTHSTVLPAIQTSRNESDAPKDVTHGEGQLIYDEEYGQLVNMDSKQIKADENQIPKEVEELTLTEEIECSSEKVESFSEALEEEEPSSERAVHETPSTDEYEDDKSMKYFMKDKKLPTMEKGMENLVDVEKEHEEPISKQMNKHSSRERSEEATNEEEDVEYLPLGEEANTEVKEPNELPLSEVDEEDSVYMVADEKLKEVLQVRTSNRSEDEITEKLKAAGSSTSKIETFSTTVKGKTNKDQEHALKMKEAQMSKSKGSLISSPVHIDVSRRSGSELTSQTKWTVSKRGHRSTEGMLLEVQRRSEIDTSSKKSQNEDNELLPIEKYFSVEPGSLISLTANISTPTMRRRSSANSFQQSKQLTTKQRDDLSAGKLGALRRSAQRVQTSDMSEDEEEEEQMMKAREFVGKGSQLSSPAVKLTPVNMSTLSSARSSWQIGQLTSKESNDVSARGLGSIRTSGQQVQSSNTSENEEGEQIMKDGRSVHKGSLISSPVHIDVSRRSGSELTSQTKWTVSKRGHRSTEGMLPEVQRRSEIDTSSKKSQNEDNELLPIEKYFSVEPGSRISLTANISTPTMRRRSSANSFQKRSRLSSPAVKLTPVNMSTLSSARSSWQSGLLTSKESDDVSARGLGSIRRSAQQVQSSNTSENEEGEQIMKDGRSVHKGSQLSSPAVKLTPVNMSTLSSARSSWQSGQLTSKESDDVSARGLGSIRRSAQQVQSSNTSENEEGEQIMKDGRSVHKGSLISSPVHIDVSRRSGSELTSQTKWTVSKRGHRSTEGMLPEVQRRSEIDTSSKKSQNEDNELLPIEKYFSVEPGSRISLTANISTPSMRRRSSANSFQQSKQLTTKQRDDLSAGKLGALKRRAQRVQTSDMSEDEEEEEQMMKAREFVGKGSLISSPPLKTTPSNLSRHSLATSSQRSQRLATEEMEDSAGKYGTIKRSADRVQSLTVSDEEEEPILKTGGLGFKGSQISSPAVKLTPANMSTLSSARSSWQSGQLTSKESDDVSARGLRSVRRSAQQAQSSNTSENEEGEQIMNDGGSVHKGTPNTSHSVLLTPATLGQSSDSLLTSHTKQNSAKGVDWLTEYANRQSSSEAVIRQSNIMQEDDENEEQSTDTDESESDERTVAKEDFLPIQVNQGVRLSSSLATPHYLKKFPRMLPVAKPVAKKTSKAPPRKKEVGLPRSLVKQGFAHYAKVPVARDCYNVVEQSLNIYFKQLSADLAAFAAHAGRKTVEAADVELLMRRQGLVTDEMPLNVLIERYLPLEYRKLLIPVATSGNKIVLK